jgi:GT2 family glycosyltransferase
MPQISIVIPTYNGSRFIHSALTTVLSQTFSDWELIVVDDGSADGTPDVMKEYASEPRITILRQDNQGLARARNRGLAVAQGDYVAFLDVDDQWRPTYLAHMGRALEHAPQAVAAVAGWQYMDAAGKPSPQSIILSAAEVARLDQDLYWRNALVPSALVARRRAVLQAGGFDEQLSTCADWDLWLRLKALGTFVAVAEVLTWYRAHADSMSENVPNQERERLLVHAKHLGSLEAPVSQWPAARRQAVGYTYFNSALGYLRQGDAASAQERVRRAVTCWPGLLEQDEFYYELGCAFQPRGVRGTTTDLDLDTSAALIRDILFNDVPAAEARSARAHWGRACLVLARLARDTHNPPACRTFALMALRDAAGRDQIRATGLLARSVVPQGWTRAIRRLRTVTGVSRPN